MTTRKGKQRAAPQRDRDIVAVIAAGLRNKPLGPDDQAPADAVVWSIDTVLILLDHFAEHGTFDLAAGGHLARSRRNALIPPFYRTLRDRGDNCETAVEKLAAEFGCSESTVRALVPAAYSKKGPPILK